MSWIKFGIGEDAGAFKYLHTKANHGEVPERWVTAAQATALVDKAMTEKTFFGQPKYASRSDAVDAVSHDLTSKKIAVMSGDGRFFYPQDAANQAELARRRDAERKIVGEAAATGIVRIGGLGLLGWGLFSALSGKKKEPFLNPKTVGGAALFGVSTVMAVGVGSEAREEIALRRRNPTY